MIQLTKEFWLATSEAGLSPKEIQLLLVIATLQNTTRLELRPLSGMGRDAYEKTIKSLKDKGYVRNNQQKQKAGKFGETSISIAKVSCKKLGLRFIIQPFPENQGTVPPFPEKPCTENQGTVSPFPENQGTVGSIENQSVMSGQGLEQPENRRKKTASTLTNYEVISNNTSTVSTDEVSTSVLDNNITINNNYIYNKKKEEEDIQKQKTDNSNQKIKAKKFNPSKAFAIIFDEALQENFGRTMDKWSPRDLRHLKNIRTRIIEALRKASNRPKDWEPSPEALCASFRHLLQAATTCNAGWFLKNHFTPAGIDSQYDKIRNAYSYERDQNTSNPQRSNQGRGAAWDSQAQQVFDRLDEFYEQRDRANSNPNTSERNGKTLGDAS